MEKQEAVGVTSLIKYPEEVNRLLERYCTAHRIAKNLPKRVPKSLVLVSFFQFFALDALKQATEALEAEVAAMPPKMPKKRGRPRKMVK